MLYCVYYSDFKGSVEGERELVVRVEDVSYF